MLRRTILAAVVVTGAVLGVFGSGRAAQAAGEGQPPDWGRFYYYPYVYYPHNFQPPVQYDHMYYRYPVERRIPVFNTNWHNFYTMPKPYHWGNWDKLDVF